MCVLSSQQFEKSNRILTLFIELKQVKENWHIVLHLCYKFSLDWLHQTGILLKLVTKLLLAETEIRIFIFSNWNWYSTMYLPLNRFNRWTSVWIAQEVWFKQHGGHWFVFLGMHELKNCVFLMQSKLIWKKETAFIHMQKCNLDVCFEHVTYSKL